MKQWIGGSGGGTPGGAYSELFDDPFDALAGFLGDGLAYTIRPDTDGLLQVRIVRYELVPARNEMTNARS